MIRDPLFRSLYAGEKSCIEKQIGVSYLMRLSKAFIEAQLYSTYPPPLLWMLTSPSQLIRVGHKERPSGHPRNEIRKEKKPREVLSNDKPTWRRVDTRFSASCLGLFRSL